MRTYTTVRRSAYPQETYGGPNFTVLGFPCNQFGEQEPGTDAQIAEFAKSNYDVNFPIFSKIDVNGDRACDLYKTLRKQQPNEDGTEDVQWNFTKFLVDKEGNCIKRIGPRTPPEEIATELAQHL
jgi:glutathione peroxidase